MKNLLLFGTPNVGKTTIYNKLTHSNDRVSNFEGATLEKKVSTIKGMDYELIDIPGTNTIGGKSIVDEIAFRSIINEDYERIIDVIDVTNIKKNLYLLIDLLETGRSVSVIINMMDIFGGKFNKKTFSEKFCCNVITTSKKEAELPINEILTTKNNCFVIDYGEEIEQAISQLIPLIKTNLNVNQRFIAIQLLKNNEYSHAYFNDLSTALIISEELSEKIKAKNLARSTTGLFFIKRKQFIDNHLAQFYEKSADKNELKWMNKYFDKIALHHFWGYVLFIALMYIVFLITYQGGILQDIVDGWVTSLSTLISQGLIAINTPMIIQSFLIDGVIAGVGGVLVFLPQIIIMFTLLTVLEAVGYFSRITVLFENIFDKLGLSSHSMIPYISGLGCNVIGIMSTRTIKDEKKRIATILTAPFISCSARLPVYIIFVDIFFDQYKSLILLFLYLLGIVVAILVAFVLDRFIYKSQKEMLLINLPKYKKIERKYLLRIVKGKVSSFINNAGKFILIGTIVIWVVTNLGFNGYTADINESFLGIIASHIKFIFAPLGFGTTEATASLMSAFLAKELAISSMLVMYNTVSVDNLSVVLQSHFSPASAMAFMVFTLLYIPCFSTLGAIYSELKQKKYVLYSVVLSLTIGYLLAWITYNVMLIIT